VAESFKRIVRVPTRRQLKRADLKGKRVLVRFDYNVPTVGDEIEDTKRIEATLPTIRAIVAGGASELNIICHLGRPEGKQSPEFSTKPVAKALASFVGVRFNPKAEKTDLPSPALATYYKVGDKVRVFENLRFDPGEEKNSSAFAKQLSTLGDVFVQDAFANIHREHASMVAVAKLLPTYAGFLVENEINALFRLLNQPDKPFVAIIGGAKFSDKLPIIEALSKIADTVIVGGKTANEWLLDKHPKTGNVFLPADGINAHGGIVEISEKTLKGGIYDIGPQTIMLFKSILASARTIFWNGNLGMTENRKFVHGTYEIARQIVKLKAMKVASGGNTAEVIDELKLDKSFDFISTGGGATSDFIIGKKMPALELLLK